MISEIYASFHPKQVLWCHAHSCASSNRVRLNFIVHGLVSAWLRWKEQRFGFAFHLGSSDIFFFRLKTHES